MKQTLNKFCFYVSRLNKITWHDQFLQQVTYYILLLLNKNGNKNKSLLRGCATAAHQPGRARAVASKPLHSENDYPPVGKFNTVSSHITNSVSACVVIKIRSAAALMWCEALLHLHSSIRPSVPDSVTVTRTPQGCRAAGACRTQAELQGAQLVTGITATAQTRLLCLQTLILTSDYTFICSHVNIIQLKTKYKVWYYHRSTIGYFCFYTLYNNNCNIIVLLCVTNHTGNIIMEIISPVSNSSYLEIIKIISKMWKVAHFCYLLTVLLFFLWDGNKTGRRKWSMS